MIDYLYPLSLLAMTVTVGAAVPMLFMLRVKMSRYPGLGVGIIIIDGLLTLKALAVLIGIALTWSLIMREDGRLDRGLLSIVLVLVAFQGWVTLIRLLYWWSDMRRQDVEGF